MPTITLGLRNFSADPVDSWGPLLERAEEAEAAGFDRVVVSEHVVFGERLDDYGRPELGGTEGGRQPTGPDGEWLDPLVVLSFVAARTTRLRLMTGILLAALRRPVVLAKTAATFDVLSGGRLDLGVGVGWQREEYDAAGLDFAQRGRLLDETLATCRAYWTEPVVAGGFHQMPKPVQPGGVPVWVSGRSTNPRVVRRVVEHGGRWVAWGDDIADPRPGIDTMRRALEAAGGDPDALEVSVTARAPDIGTLPAGVTDVRLHAAAGDLAEIVDRFRQARG